MTFIRPFEISDQLGDHQRIVQRQQHCAEEEADALRHRGHGRCEGERLGQEAVV
jgi:hypothetical protein